MSHKKRGAMALLFLRDRLLLVLCVFTIIGLACCIYWLEKMRYPGLVETGTIYYFVVLAVLVLVVWLGLDYVRQRYFLKQMKEALNDSDHLQAMSIIQSPATGEQKLVSALLQDQHRAYLNELNKYKRQQELHNHFVMQWVHHMKTPVSVIDLHTQETLRQPPENEEEWREMIGSVQEETDRLTRGLEMMLYTARLGKFELDLHIRKTALHELIRGAINAHKRLCIRYSIYPRVEGECWVETDEKWIVFVINQLISNAIKYSKAKPGAKTLLFRMSLSGDTGNLLEIKDEGIGIASHDLPRIFDAFFTGENGRGTGESTGMGLYLAHQVCMRMGHSLTATSQLREGTTFRIGFASGGIHIMNS